MTTRYYASILDAEKAVAVTLRREFSDVLPTTDDWRPIAQRACQLIAERVASGLDYERADAAFRIALATKGVDVEDLPTFVVAQAIVQAALSGDPQ